MRDRLRQARIAAGLRQRDIASIVGISIPFYCQIETGKRRANIELAGNIAKALSMPLDGLFDREASPHA